MDSSCVAEEQRKKVKVNAILDDVLNETFLNENVANFLGQERFQTVQVHVLNNSVETFQSMPVKMKREWRLWQSYRGEYVPPSGDWNI